MVSYLLRISVAPFTAADCGLINTTHTPLFSLRIYKSAFLIAISHPERNARKVRKHPAVMGDRKPSKEAISCDGCVPKDFPVGMRVLVVDDNPTCLAILKQMLVKTCSEAKTALTLLEKNKGEFDIVLSEVHMPDMDGLELLELVGLQMDLPVIMMSADGDIDTVMKGIRHGARDYLIKPVRMEALRNLWQHVLRQKLHNGKEISSSLENPDHLRNEKSEGSSKSRTKRGNPTENDDSELDDEDPSSKKTRIAWTPELHYQFVNAVRLLGSASAKPKKILELMNAHGLTRSNVSSHLQKFRKYLVKINGVKDPNTGLDSSVVSELLGQPSDNFAISAINPSRMNQNSMLVPSYLPSNFPALNAPVSYDPNSNYKCVSPNLDFGLFSAPPNRTPMDMGQGVMEDFNNYSILGQTSSSVLSCINRSTNWQVQTSDVNLDHSSSFPRHLSNLYNMQDSQAQVGTLLDQGPETNIGFTGKGACLRSRTFMDDTESPNNINQHMGGDGKSEEGSSAFGCYGHR